MLGCRRLAAWVAGFAFLFTFTSAFSLAAGAQEGVLWVGETQGALRIATADGSVLGEIEEVGHVRALGVDPVGERVWLYSWHELHAYGLDGTPRLSATVPGLPLATPRMAVDPAAGTAWLAGLARLVGFDSAGQVIADEVMAELVRSLAVDPVAGVVWVAGERDLYAYDSTSGAPVGTVSLGSGAPPIRSVAVDAGGDLWIATRDDLRRLAADGTEELRVELPELCHVVVDGAGGAWAAGLADVVRVAADGSVVAAVEPFSSGGWIVDLSADPRDGSVWVANLKRLARLDGGGTVGPALSFGLFVYVRDLDLWRPPVPPAVAIEQPAEGALLATGTTEIVLAFAAGDQPVDPGTLAIAADGAPIAVSCELEADGGSCMPVAPLADGARTVTAIVADVSGRASEPASVTFTVDTVAPGVTVDSPEDGALTSEPEQVVSGSVSEPVALTLDGSPVTVEADLTFAHPVTLAEGENVLTLKATDPAGHVGVATLAVTLDTSDPGGDLPSDPSAVASPLDRTVATDVASSTEFLYTGPDPVQTGVSPGAIEPDRAAVVRGRVLDRSGDPLPGVTVSVRGHAEYGSTLSRADGMFDLAVNGGGPVAIDYEKEGYLPSQRTVEAPWKDWAWAEDVVLVALAPEATPITSGAAEVQVARGAVETDADGSRRASLLFPAGTSAEMVLPDGSRQALPTLTLRATEYTVGESGPEAMPGPLPTGVGYTYAVELSADEAIAASVRSVELSQPAYLYVENFLAFPVGEVVPAGWYDRQVAAWVASDNGRVIEVVGVDGAGRAEVDLDGDGAAESGVELAELGFTDGERVELAGLYAPGTQLWRIPIPHLTPWDCNWPYVPPEDAELPPEDDPSQDEGRDEDDPDCTDGSIIECQTQVFGEELPVVGTLFSLHYGSDRVPGRTAGYTLPITLSGSTVPVSLKRIELHVRVAGQRRQWTFPPEPDQSFTFTWDGLDAYGRRVQGASEVRVTKSYVYDLVYTAASDGFDRSWDRFPDGSYEPIGGGRSSGEVRLSRTRRHTVALEGRSHLGGWDATAQRLGGWTLDVHHAYDPVAGRLWLGDGRRRSASALPPLLYGVANLFPRGIAVGPDGSLYVTEPFAHRVRRIDRSGLQTVFAGDGDPCEPADPDDPPTSSFCGEGGPATAAQLREPRGVSVAPDGSVLIADSGNNCVRRVGVDGIIETVAGECDGGEGDGPVFLTEGGTKAIRTIAAIGDPGCDECPATEALLASPRDVVAAPDGSFYISDRENDRIRRVGTDGRITTVAGGGDPPDALGDGGPATEAEVFRPAGIALGPDGTLYIAQNHRIRRVTPDGRISTLLGAFLGDFCGDGGPAADACVSGPQDVHVAPDGSLLIADSGNRRLRRIAPSGVIETIAGGTENGLSGAEIPGSAATGVELDSVGAVTTSPEGDVYITHGDGVLQVSAALGGLEEGETLIPDAGGRRVFVFDDEGRHLRTVDALTGAVLHTLRYDAAGLLIEVEDIDGLVTRIERGGGGDATAVVGPFGQRTELRVGADGYLAELENPAGEVTRFDYSGEGLLETLTDPRGHDWTYGYFGSGRLARAEDPAGGFKTLTRTQGDGVYDVELTTGLGRTTTYVVQRGNRGERSRTRHDPDGTVTHQEDGSDGSRAVSYPDGSESEVFRAADPRWGFLASLPGESRIETPGGLVSEVTTDRSITLADPDDPLSLQTQVDTVTVNGETSTRSYDATNRRFTLTSPEGRQRFVTLDAKGRPVRAEVPGIAPIELTHDGQGRLAQIAQGTGAERRTVTFGYGADGWLDAITDPLSRTTGFIRDAAGRTTAQTLPDGRTVGFSYDPNGNLSGLTPPEQPEHGFGYTPVDLASGYDPPDVPGVSPDATGYTYDLDRRLDLMTRPDGGTVNPIYDPATGRLTSIGLPGGESLNYTYDATSGDLTSVSGPDGVSVSYTHDGFLPTGTTWSGEVAGTVAHTYDEDLQVVERRVNGADPVAFAYDRDGLLVAAGALTLDRDPANGLLTGTTLGQVTTTRSHDAFGELATETAAFGGAELYRVAYLRDAMGRIEEKTETIGGVTATWGYDYDPSGRLIAVTRDGSPHSTYTYDQNGNRLTYDGPFGAATATYDAQDRLLAYGDTSYTYTASGELASKSQGEATISFDYDALGSLRGVTLATGLALDYVVDGQARRVGKKVGGTLVEGFLYQDQLEPVAELDGTGAVVARFVYGSRPHVPDCRPGRRHLPHRLRPPRQRPPGRRRRHGRDRPAPRLRRLRPYHPRHQPRLPALRLRRRPLRPADRARTVRGQGLRPGGRALDGEGPDRVRGWHLEPLFVSQRRSYEPHRLDGPRRLYRRFSWLSDHSSRHRRAGTTQPCGSGRVRRTGKHAVLRVRTVSSGRSRSSAPPSHPRSRART
jgi:YD repeat-containing protein